MDPLSIATGSAALTKSAFTIALALQSRIEANKDSGANAILHALYGDLTALRSALSLVGKKCEGQEMKELDHESWKSDSLMAAMLQWLRTILRDCEETLANLDSILRQAKHKSSTELNSELKSAGIGMIKEKIQAYMDAMQMTIPLLNITVKLTQRQAPSDIERIALETSDLQKHEKDLRMTVQSSGLSYSTSSKSSLNLKCYLELSDSLASRAASLYGTEAGSVVESCGTEKWTADTYVAAALRNRSAIEAWRSNAGLVNSRNSFVTRIAAKRYDVALEHFANQRHSEAVPLLETCLSTPGLEDDRMFYARLLLVICYKRKKDFGKANEAFHQLLYSTELPKRQTASINRHISEIHLARNAAKKTLPYHLRACENYHSDSPGVVYYESCRLATKAYQLMGNFAEAALYWEELPIEARCRGKISSKLIKRFEVDSGTLHNVVAIPSRNQIAVLVSQADQSGRSYELYIWDMPGAEIRKVLHNTSTSFSHLQVSHDGQTFVFAEGQVVKVLNPGHQAIVLRDMLGSCSGIESIVLSADGQHCVLQSSKGKLEYHTLGQNKVSRYLTGPSIRGRCAWLGEVCGHGIMLATRSDTDHVIELRKFPTLDLLTQIECTTEGEELAFSQDGTKLAFACGLSDIEIWDMTTVERKHILQGHAGMIHNLRFSPCGNLLASASFDDTIKLWDTKSGNLLQTLEGQTYLRFDLGFSSDGLYLITGSLCRNIHVWAIYYD